MLPAKTLTVLEELSRVSGYVWNLGWAEGNGGNISINLGEMNLEPDTTRILPAKISEGLKGLTFLSTISGSRFRDSSLNPEGTVVFLEGTDKGWQIVHSPDEQSKPTSEWVSHAKIHESLLQTDMKVVMHSHPPNIIALTHMPGITEERLNNILFGLHPELRIFLSDGIGFPPYAMPGTMELAKRTIESLESHRVVIWPFHGALAVGETIEGAFDLLHMVEKCAGIYLKCLSAGFRPEGLTENQLNELDRWWKDRLAY